MAETMACPCGATFPDGDDEVRCEHQATCSEVKYREELRAQPCPFCAHPRMGHSTLVPKGAVAVYLTLLACREDGCDCLWDTEPGTHAETLVEDLQCGKGDYVCGTCLDDSLDDLAEPLDPAFMARGYQKFLAGLTPELRAEWDRCAALFGEKFG